MKLTEKKAIEISIELWTWLAETGASFKFEWSGWEKYGMMANDCALCELSFPRRYPRADDACDHCPYNKRFGPCQSHIWGGELTPYDKWCEARTKKGRKLYASKFLEQLKELLK